jgi:hypothetical protein
MSASNGNRSRFHIDRKRRIARRMQLRAVAQALTEKRAAAAAAESTVKQGENPPPGSK